MLSVKVSRQRQAGKIAMATAGRLPGRRHNPTPTILFDIMDTVVKDPFYETMPAFFGISFKEVSCTAAPTRPTPPAAQYFISSNPLLPPLL